MGVGTLLVYNSPFFGWSKTSKKMRSDERGADRKRDTEAERLQSEATGHTEEPPVPRSAGIPAAPACPANGAACWDRGNQGDTLSLGGSRGPPAEQKYREISNFIFVFFLNSFILNLLSRLPLFKPFLLPFQPFLPFQPCSKTPPATPTPPQPTRPSGSCQSGDI